MSVHGRALIPLLLLVLSAQAHGFCFEEAGRCYGVSAELLRSIAVVESDMDPRALRRNADGNFDVGLMQINSRWAPLLGPERWSHVWDPCYNVMLGAWILRLCVERYGYTWDAMACYHTGQGLSSPIPEKRRAAAKYVSRIRAALKAYFPAR